MILIGIHPYPVTIASGQSLSGAVPMGVDTLAGIVVPSAWTAAALTFQVSIDDGANWLNLYDESNEIAITSPVAGSFIMVNSHPSSAWFGINMIKVRSGTAGAPVAQGADRVLTLIGRPLNF